jgi:uncharacterized protein YdiU (UPF0061 family)
MLAGNAVPRGRRAAGDGLCRASVRHFVPQLGDGRAILLGEVIDRDGVRRDIQLKGSGPTPFSRRGDGRAALGPVLREYIVSEAMAALGSHHARAGRRHHRRTSLARDALPGAVFTRVAASHIRVGTFQFFAARRCRGRARSPTTPSPAITRRPRMPKSPIARCSKASSPPGASLVAKWMLLGFIHGVMNTDNMPISGETIDYGPCAFMDCLRPGHGLQLDRRQRPLCLRQPAAASRCGT